MFLFCFMTSRLGRVLLLSYNTKDSDANGQLRFIDCQLKLTYNDC